MYMIIESLNKLGRLDVAVDRLEQRLPIELFNIVGKTNLEVDQRYPGHFGPIAAGRKGTPDIDYDGNSSQSHVLREFLTTLYSKFTAIAEGHRAVHEVVAGIVVREGLRHPESLMGGFKELWKLYQSEVSCLKWHCYNVILNWIDTSTSTRLSVHRKQLLSVKQWLRRRIQYLPQSSPGENKGGPMLPFYISILISQSEFSNLLVSIRKRPS